MTCSDPRHKGIRPMQELFRHSMDEFKRQSVKPPAHLIGRPMSALQFALLVVSGVNVSLGLGLTDAQVRWTAERIPERLGVAW